MVYLVGLGAWTTYRLIRASKRVRHLPKGPERRRLSAPIGWYRRSLMWTGLSLLTAAVLLWRFLQ